MIHEIRDLSLTITGKGYIFVLEFLVEEFWEKYVLCWLVVFWEKYRKKRILIKMKANIAKVSSFLILYTQSNLRTKEAISILLSVFYWHF